MDICSITQFCEALRMSDDHFATLKIDVVDRATIRRTTHFVESFAECNGRMAMIYAPISRHATTLMQRADIALVDMRRTNNTSYMVLHNEMICDSYTGRRCSIVVEYLPPKHITLRCAVTTHDRNTLIQGLERFAAQLHSYNISHNNLTVDNIVIDNSGRWYALRQYYSTIGEGDDSPKIAELRAFVEQQAPENCTTQSTKYRCSIDSTDVAEPLSTYSLTYDTFPLIEDRRAIRTERGMGFVNGAGELVIEDIYLWVDDFAEGRAMVRSHSNKMGLIDKYGREIIPIVYDIVEYMVSSGETWVCCNKLWARFDYGGKQLTSWQQRNECYIEL